MKNHVLITFLDLAKAFDSVDRNKLIQKLDFVGVKNKSLDWFISYFDNRRQIVTINGVDSDSVNVDYGVVQGSTLGPLLFLIYINNISKIYTNGDIFLFADDTALVCSGCTWDEAYSQASSDLAKIKNWFDHNILTVNISKTKCLPLFMRNDSDPGPRTLRMHSCGDPRSAACGCGIIERVEQYKYLGIIIDHKLNWVPHVQYIKQRLRKMIYAFTQLGQVLSVEHCRTVYFAYVQSLLQYGIVAWGGASSAVLEPLAVTQRAIIKKIINKSQRYPSHMLYSDFPVLPVKHLYLKTLLVYIKMNKYKIFTEVQHDYPTRNKMKFGYVNPKLTHKAELSNSFYLSHTLYRNLPHEMLIAESDSVAVFKRRVSEWLLGLDAAAVEALIQSPYS